MQATFSFLRLTGGGYWVLRDRYAVKAVINRCSPCLRYSGHKVLQKMGNLPGSRTNAEFPFQKTGVDYAGPVLVRMTKSRGKETMKAYIALFVCMKTHRVSSIHGP